MAKIDGHPLIRCPKYNVGPFLSRDLGLDTILEKTLLQGEPQPKLEKLILIDDSNIDALHKQTSLLTTLAHSPYCNMIAVIIF